MGYTHWTVYTHTFTQACWVISLPKAGSAHSLYCSGVQYGASPKDRQRKNTMFSGGTKKQDKGFKEAQRKTGSALIINLSYAVITVLEFDLIS